MRFIVFLSLIVFGCTESSLPPTSLEVPEAAQITEQVVMASLRKPCPRLRSYWVMPPNVSVCDNTAISVRTVQSALDVWRGMGYTFGIVRQKRWALNGCQSPEFFEILIRLPTQTEVSMGLGRGFNAVTKTHEYTPTQQIQGADIFYVDQSKVGHQYILEHEIGHALGWQHCKQYGHLMHPETNSLGSGKTGITRKDYESEILHVREEVDARK